MYATERLLTARVCHRSNWDAQNAYAPTVEGENLDRASLALHPYQAALWQVGAGSAEQLALQPLVQAVRLHC